MSEKITIHAEKESEHLEVSQDSSENLSRLQEIARNATNETKENVESLQQRVAAEAISSTELSVDHHASNKEANQPLGLHQELKQTEYKRTLARVRGSLNPADRTMSRIIHQPVVDKLSEVTARTIARPRGLLFGGLFACLGSIVFLYFSKYYGFRYNYLLFIALFVCGYFFGLILDLFFRSSRQS